MEGTHEESVLVSPDVNIGELTAKSHCLRGATRVNMMPLGLAAVAALAAEDIEVDIWDEGSIPVS